MAIHCEERPITNQGHGYEGLIAFSTWKMGCFGWGTSYMGAGMHKFGNLLHSVRCRIVTMKVLFSFSPRRIAIWGNSGLSTCHCYSRSRLLLPLTTSLVFFNVSGNDADNMLVC